MQELNNVLSPISLGRFFLIQQLVYKNTKVENAILV